MLGAREDEKKGSVGTHIMTFGTVVLPAHAGLDVRLASLWMQAFVLQTDHVLACLEVRG